MSTVQAVLHCVLSGRDTDELLQLPNCATWLPGLLPYTEKHTQRLSRLKVSLTYGCCNSLLQVKSQFVPFLLHQMKATSMPISSLGLDRPE